MTVQDVSFLLVVAAALCALYSPKAKRGTRFSLWFAVVFLVSTCVYLRSAYAADTKITDLTATSTAVGTQELPTNDSGTDRKITLAQIAGYTRKLISGNSGAANGAAAPSETWQILTANCTANSTTTPATCMTTTGLPIGTYFYEYHIRYQSATTTVGVNFVVDYTGTVTRTSMTRIGVTGLATAADGIQDQVVNGLTGGAVQHWSGRSDAANLGPSTGVDTINADQYEMIRGILVVSTSANLVLQHASETATSTQVMADTMLFLKRIQ